MGKSGKGKDKPSGKDERKARKAEVNRVREKGKNKHRKEIDSASLASFTKMLLSEGYELTEVQRDGNCFFRSVADQLDNNEHNYECYRSRICEHLKAHEDDFSPFMSFGESEEEEDKDYESYCERMGMDGEWAGQVELIAAAQALTVSIVVHQLEHPSYRIECSAVGTKKPPREIHVSYHDGEHYNSVHSRTGARTSRSKSGGRDDAEDPPAAGAAGEDALASGQAAVDIADDAAGDEEAVATAAAATTAAAAATGGLAAEEGEEEAPAPASLMEKARDAKARKKEEKRTRKEQKHKEAVAAARGAVEPDEAVAVDGSASERILVVL